MDSVLHLFPYAIAIALIAVVAVLFAGLVTLARGGRFGNRYSNKLMQARVGLQALAVVLMLVFWFLLRGA